MDTMKEMTQECAERSLYYEYEIREYYSEGIIQAYDYEWPTLSDFKLRLSKDEEFAREIQNKLMMMTSKVPSSMRGPRGFYSYARRVGMHLTMLRTMRLYLDNKWLHREIRLPPYEVDKIGRLSYYSRYQGKVPEPKLPEIVSITGPGGRLDDEYLDFEGRTPSMALSEFSQVYILSLRGEVERRPRRRLLGREETAELDQLQKDVEIEQMLQQIRMGKSAEEWRSILLDRERSIPVTTELAEAIVNIEAVRAIVNEEDDYKESQNPRMMTPEEALEREEGVLVVTSSEQKIIQAKQEADLTRTLGVCFLKQELLEIQGTPRENLEYKLAQVAVEMDPVLIMDDSVEVKAWGGYPGIYAKSCIETMGPARITQSVDPRDTSVKQIGRAIYRDGVDKRYYKSERQGFIVPTSKSYGSWDSIISPSEAGLSYQERGEQQSPRRQVLRQAYYELALTKSDQKELQKKKIRKKGKLVPQKKKKSKIK